MHGFKENPSITKSRQTLIPHASLGFPYFLDRDARLYDELRRGYQARVIEDLLRRAPRELTSPYATPEYVAGRDYQSGRDC